MPDLNTTTIIVAALSCLGVGGFGREIFAGLGRLMRGVSLKESDRKLDLAGQRDRAEAKAIASDERAERFQRNSWQAMNFAASLERVLILNGLQDQIPASPVFEDTIGPARLREIRGGKTE